MNSVFERVICAINLSLLLSGVVFVRYLIVAEFIVMFDAKKSRIRKGGELGNKCE